jgi:basic membrane protein A
MKRERLYIVLVILSLVLVACTSPAEPAEQPAEEASAEEEAAPAEEPSEPEEEPSEATAGGEPIIPADELRVAMLLDGPINDQGWNQGAYDGLAALRVKYQAEGAYSESVPRADMETVFTDYAARGYNVIVAHGYEFSDAAARVAEQYPDTIFIVTHGTSGIAGGNVATIQYEEEQLGFLLGVVGGHMTEANKLAAIGGYEIPSISIPFQAFELGAKEVNPDVEVTISWIDSWTDIAKMKEAASAAIANGADVVLPVASGASAGGLDAAAEADVWAIGYSGDQYVFAPEVTLTSGIVDTALSIELVVDKIVDGTFEPTDYWFGFEEGVLRLAPYHNTEDDVPQEVKDDIAEWTRKIIEGEFEVPLQMEF